MILIKQVINGWILEDKTDEEMPRTFVFSEGETEKSACEGFASLLWQLNDIYGPTTSRYSAHRIHIKIRPGDKYEGGDGDESSRLDEDED